MMNLKQVCIKDLFPNKINPVAVLITFFVYSKLQFLVTFEQSKGIFHSSRVLS